MNITSAIDAHFFAPTAIAKAADILGVSEKAFSSKSKDPMIAEARFALWYVIYNRGSSLSQIGRRFNRDHTSIKAGIHRAEELMSNPRFAEFVEAIRG